MGDFNGPEGSCNQYCEKHGALCVGGDYPFDEYEYDCRRAADCEDEYDCGTTQKKDPWDCKTREEHQICVCQEKSKFYLKLNYLKVFSDSI